MNANEQRAERWRNFAWGVLIAVLPVQTLMMLLLDDAPSVMTVTIQLIIFAVTKLVADMYERRYYADIFGSLHTAAVSMANTLEVHQGILEAHEKGFRSMQTGFYLEREVDEPGFSSTPVRHRVKFDR